MGVSVKINNKLYELAKAEAQNEGRTLAGQIEFWIKVGRTAIDNPDLPTPFIAEVLASLSESSPAKPQEYKLAELLAQWNPEIKHSKEDDE